jgi:hypothetical protein
MVCHPHDHTSKHKCAHDHTSKHKCAHDHTSKHKCAREYTGTLGNCVGSGQSSSHRF